MQLIREPRDSSAAAAFTKLSTKWLTVVPMAPPYVYSSVRAPDTNVKQLRSMGLNVRMRPGNAIFYLR
jgi:hypothetical protein